ncbi:MAG: hypothetical protein AB8H47_18005 [Bacteroidia bacterium]
MLKRLPLLGLILLLSLPKFMLGQVSFTDVPFKKPPSKQGYMFPHEDERGCKFMLLYPTRFDFRLLYLDQDLQLLEEKRASLSSSLYEVDLLHFINRPRTLLIYVDYPFDGGYTTLALDKRTGQLTNTGLNIPEGDDVIGLQHIIQEDVLTVFQLEANSSNIRVYQSLDGYSYQADTMQLPVDNLHKRMRKGERYEIPIITREGGNSLLTNYLPERFYKYGSALSLVVDDPDLGFAQRFDFDLENDRLETDTIYYPRFSEETPLEQANSLLFEDLFVVSSIQEEGLKLAIYEFGQAEPIQEYAYAAADELAPHFFEIEAERTDGREATPNKDLFKYLNKSLIVSLEPNGQGDLWLMVGAYPHVSQGTQDLLMFGIMMSSMMMGVGVGLQPTGINGLSFDPAAALGSTGDIISYSISRYNKFVYRVGLLQAKDLQLAEIEKIVIPEATVEETSSAKAEEDAYQQILSYMKNNSEYKSDLRAQIIFPYKDGLVLGYAFKRQLKLIYFENR